MTSGTSSGLPRLLPGTDLRQLPLTPAEAFVVSRIDGVTTVAEIAEETGNPLPSVEALLERLLALGAIAMVDEAPRSQPRRGSPAPAPQTSGTFRWGAVVETRSASEIKHPAASLYDPAELDEPVDIELPRRRQILDLYYRLDQLTHYEVFGIEPNADKPAIKAAYFEVVNVFHPDRYFAKKVGSFKPKLEKVFARLTQAYDILSRNSSRAEYDAYLRAQAKTRAFDAGQTDSAAHRAALQEVMRHIQDEASAQARDLAAARAPDSTATPSGSPSNVEPQRGHSTERAPHAPLRPSASIRPTDPESRRRALARKLGRPAGSSGSFEATPAGEEVAGTDVERQQRAAEDLKRRYQERVNAARDRQVEAYTKAAEQAIDKGDNVGAANALRIAVSLTPGDTRLAERLNEVSGKARHELAASYLAQAEYEEQAEKWLPAAQSYTRALTGRPEAKIYEKVAHCLLSGDGSLRDAGECAKKAVLLEPNNASFRLTLARFYVKAGMKQSAEGELSRAATLAPGDDKVTDWIRRLKRELG